MEAFPDLSKLSDADLKAMIDKLEEEENEISYQRRMLHGRIDMLRAEAQARLKEKGESGILKEVDVARLAEILARKAPPPLPDSSDGS